MQPSLFDVLVETPEMLKYEAFKQANPWVMPTLTKMCYQLMHRGYTHYGIAALIEVLRYTPSQMTPVANSNSTTTIALLWLERSCKNQCWRDSSAPANPLRTYQRTIK
jgi:hypothetical protein